MRTVLFIILSVVLVNCASQKADVVQRNAQSEQSSGTLQINLKEGETRFLKDIKTNITFRNITEDSRCPQGVDCIWAGVAVADLELMSVHSRPQNVQLATMKIIGRNYNNTTQFNGYEFKLIKVLPYPSDKIPSANLKGKYHITLEIRKI